MKDIHFITDVETIKVLADSVRLRFLEALIHEEASAGQLAKRYGLKMNLAAYHVGLLLQQGLITLTRTQKVRVATEKFYRAVAHNFSLDLAMGQAAGDSPELLSAREVVSRRVAAWRRETLLRIDFADFARRVIVDTLALDDGDVLLIQHGPEHLPLVEHLLAAASARRAYTLVRPLDDTRFDSMLRATPPDMLERGLLSGEGPYRVSHFIRFPLPFIESRLGTDSSDAFKAYRKGAVQFARSLAKGGGRILSLLWPDPALLTFDPERTQAAVDDFWRALTIPVSELGAEADRLLAQLDHSPRVRLVDGPGTALELELQQSERLVSVGLYQPEILERGEITLSLPSGSIQVYALPGIAHGKVRAEFGDLLGRPLGPVEVTFENGQVTAITTANPQADLAALTERGRDLLFVHFGLNPFLTESWNHPFLSRAISGAATLQIGTWVDTPQGKVRRETLSLCIRGARLESSDRKRGHK